MLVAPACFCGLAPNRAPISGICLRVPLRHKPDHHDRKWRTPCVSLILSAISAEKRRRSCTRQVRCNRLQFSGVSGPMASAGQTVTRRLTPHFAFEPINDDDREVRNAIACFTEAQWFATSGPSDDTAKSRGNHLKFEGEGDAAAGKCQTAQRLTPKFEVDPTCRGTPKQNLFRNEITTHFRRRRTWMLLVVFMAYVLLCVATPIIADWVKQQHGGRFRFAVPALTFHAWSVAFLFGVIWTAFRFGRKGLRQLWRPEMFWKFCITTSLFTVGDMLSFASMQHIDIGTFSLLGKSATIIITLLLSRLLLHRKPTSRQYALVVATTVATAVFCVQEQAANSVVRAQVTAQQVGRSGVPLSTDQWVWGFSQRIAAVFLTSVGAVLQERLFTGDARFPFMMQQCLMGGGAMLVSLFTLTFVSRQPITTLFQGFGDWRVLMMVAMYAATGMATGFLVKKLGALAKALCVPIYLGGCYLYAVRTGASTLTKPVVVAWALSTICALLFAMTSAEPVRDHSKADGPKQEIRLDTSCCHEP